MGLGEKIKYIRESVAMNQREFAKIIGCSQTFISSIELEIKKPSYEKLKIISDFAKKKKINIVLL